MGVMAVLLILGNQAGELPSSVVITRELELGSTASQLTLQRAALGRRGHCRLNLRQTFFGIGALNDVHTTKNNDSGTDSFSIQNLLRLGNFKKHANTTHLFTLKQSPISMRQTITG